ncbi:cold shock CspA family protein [Allostreptomyces psammosilenae]|uniref:Cold shock CspA family protein n=1 Tax=Allostreptomyces psammosilenae TaxID=1892865 RepID=A0A852ZXB2_9ACTN|nr:cold shock CspA family protein [Allostreptomyces psammosilenae]
MRRLRTMRWGWGGMAEGVVVWFNSEKGYGFIRPDGGGPDLYVHYSSIQANGYKTLDEGERVSFAIRRGANGPEANPVTQLGRYAAPPEVPAPQPPAPSRRSPATPLVVALLFLAAAVALATALLGQ